jgi:hypothetical protein
MRLTKAEKKAEMAEQEYIKQVRAVFKSFNGRITSDELKAEFDRLNLPRTGKVFTSLILQALDNDLEIINT